MPSPEVIGTWVSALLTLMVLSYLLGDNPLFRLAQYLFVGTAIGYAALVAIYDVLMPRLVTPLQSAPLANAALLVPGILGLLLLLRLVPGASRAGVLPLAFLLGVGVALAVGGALFGTLLPQAEGTMLSLSPATGGTGGAISNAIVVLGTLSALFYFWFTVGGRGRLARVKSGALRIVGQVGLGFIMVAFGATFASTVMSRVSLLISRVQFLLVSWLRLGG